MNGEAGLASDNPVWQSRRLWSLWEMYSLNAQRFVRIMTQMKMAETVLLTASKLKESGVPREQRNCHMKLNRPGPGPMLPMEWDELAEDLRRLELDESCITSLTRVKNMYEANGLKNDSIFSLLDEFNGRVFDQLSGRQLLSISQKRVSLFTDKGLFGEPVETAFPSASPEIVEAGKCLALDRWTAAVFHLMRVLEVGLLALGKPFSVDATHKNWQNVLEEIESRAKSMSKANGADWKAQQQFYSEAVTQFHTFKNAWRNYVMHLHERYDEERAIDIYNSVRAFMKTLAKRLKE